MANHNEIVFQSEVDHPRICVWYVVTSVWDILLLVILTMIRQPWYMNLT